MDPTLPFIPQVLSTMNPFMRQSPKANVYEEREGEVGGELLLCALGLVPSPLRSWQTLPFLSPFKR